MNTPAGTAGAPLVYVTTASAGREEISLAEVGALFGRLADPASPVAWVHSEMSDDLLDPLETLGLHEVAVKSLRGGPERPRVEEYADHLYVSLFAARPTAGAEMPVLEELRVFVGPRWLISLGHLDAADLEALQGLVERQVFARSRGPGFVLYYVAEWMVGSLSPLLDDLDDRVDGLEDLVVLSSADEARQELFRLKRDLVDLRRRIAPIRDVMQRLATHGLGFIEEGTGVYFRDVHDDVLLVIEQLDTYRDILSSALDLHLSTVSNRLNQVMKTLTVVATLFMPVTFVTGFFGQNFVRMPFESTLLFYAMVVLVTGSFGGMLVFFWRKGWL